MAAKKQDWMGMMEEWFNKLPALPKNAKEGIVKITPWIALVFGILGIIAGLAGIGILTALSPFMALSSGISGASSSLVGALLGIIASALLLAGFSGTKNKKMQGWKMVFWSELVGIVAAIISFSVGGVIVSLILFYFLFQIKSYYK